MKQERINPDWNWANKLNLSAGVKVDNTIYLSGVIAFDSDGNVVGGNRYYW
ncbi:MAG: enamine deaminase RidA (YjgF/YER057c/UK114 family) [Neolewinella sp.]|jgi:enamine deaminase RidA (YjgF/YER057c/UK114 family)